LIRSRYEFGLEGGGAQYGMSFDNYGRKFGCSNSDHLQYWVYDDQYPPTAIPTTRCLPRAKESIAVDGGAAEVFRISPDEPWRIIRTRWRIAGVVKGAVEGGGRVSGYFTGATGTTIYRGDAYGPEVREQQLLRRRRRPARASQNHQTQRKDGISLVGERPADERGFEFAASKDTWVRVVNFANAPDGCLHICDMYREVIEHPWSIPDEIKSTSTSTTATIVVASTASCQTDGSPAPMTCVAARSPKPAPKTSSNSSRTRTAGSAIPPSASSMNARTSADPAHAKAKLHALQTLQSLGGLTDQLLILAAKDSDSQVVQRALRLASTLQPLPQGLADTLKNIASTSSDARVLLETAFIAADLPGADEILLNTIRKTHAHPLVLAAALNGSQDASGLFLPLLADSKADPELRPAITALTAVIGTKNQADQVSQTIQQLVGADHLSKHLPGILTTLRTALTKSRTTIEKADTSGALKALLDQAAKTIADTTKTEEQRIAVIELLNLSNAPEASAALNAAIGSGQPEALQTAVIHTLAEGSSKELAAQLIAAWSSYGPKAREAALAALIGRSDRLPALFSAIESGTIKPTDLPASQVQALVNHKDSATATQAKAVLATVIPPSREETLKKFQPALTLKGNPITGQNHYISRCMACHRAGTMGLQVGPDLITVKTKGRDALLAAIIDPHKEVAPQFIAYTLSTKDGATLTGIVAQDEANSVTLKMMGGIQQTVQRANIQGTQSSGQSLMPEGIETGMSEQDMADLLSYIEDLK
jgi:putative heme-binding domain-containing protein